MYALLIVLNEVEYLDGILAEFVKIGVCGATILDSQGMGSAIVHGKMKQIPMFGSLQKLLTDARPYNKTIFTVLEDDALVEKAVAAVNRVVKDADQTGLGLMFTVPIGNVYPMGKSK